MTTKSAAEREIGEMATLLWQHGYAKRTGSYSEERRDARRMAEKLRAADMGLDELKLKVLRGRASIKSLLALGGESGGSGGGGARPGVAGGGSARFLEELLAAMPAHYDRPKNQGPGPRGRSLSVEWVEAPHVRAEILIHDRDGSVYADVEGEKLTDPRGAARAVTRWLDTLWEEYRAEHGGGGARSKARPLSVFEEHELRVARDTRGMPDAILGVMGGPTKAQAREGVRRLTGKASAKPKAPRRVRGGG